MKLNPDNKILNGLSAAFDALLLGFYMMLCCIPVLTAGAGITAALSVLLETDGGSGGVSRSYFHAFRENFKLATALWLIVLVLGAFLAADLVIVARLPAGSPVKAVLKGTTALAALALALVLGLAPGIAAKFKVSLGQVFYNVLVLTAGRPAIALALAALAVGELLSLVLLPVFGCVPAAALLAARGALFRRLFKEHCPGAQGEE